MNGGAGQIAARVTTIEVIRLTSDVIRGDLFLAIKDAEFKRTPEFGGARLNAHGGIRTGTRRLGDKRAIGRREKKVDGDFHVFVLRFG